MQPVAGERTVFCAFGLGDLVFMVRKNKIGSAAVNVEGLAEIFTAHGRALDMPARTAFPPGAVPGRLSGLAGLPEGKVHGMALARVHFYARPGRHIFQTTMGQLAVFGKTIHRIIHISIHGVRELFGFELVDEGNHLRDVLGCAWLMRRRQAAEGLHVGVEGLNIHFGQLFGRDASLIGTVDNFVVHIGEIAHKRHLVTGELEVTIDDVKGDQGTRMTNMGTVVYRYPTHIHAGFARRERDKRLFFSRQGIVKTQGHAFFLKITPTTPNYACSRPSTN